MKMFRSTSHQEINSELDETLVLLKLTRQLEKVLNKVCGTYYVLVLQELNKSQISSVAKPCHSYNDMNNAVSSSINGRDEIRFTMLMKSLRGDAGL